MTVPTKMGDLSSTIASNSPAGTDTIGTSLDDYIRAAYGIMKQGSSKGSDIASVTTLTIPDAGSYFVVTGTTTITGINDSWTGRMVVLKFSGALQLTHGSGFILPGGANITTVAGDVGIFVNESTGVWRAAAWTSGTFAGLTVDDVDDTPVNGATTAPVSSNWAYDHAADTTTHGTTGDIVGTSDTQTLTNKTIVAGSNSPSGFTLNADADVSSNTWVIDEDDMSSDLATKVPTQQSVKAYVDSAPGVFGTALLHVQDQKASGTNGGTNVVGYNTRDLNQSLTNEISGASLSSNQIHLPAGTYYLEASAPAYNVGNHQLRIYDTTATAYILDGTSEYTASTVSTISKCAGRFTLSTTSVLELRHLTKTVAISSGLGADTSSAGTIDHNTYAECKIWKLS